MAIQNIIKNIQDIMRKDAGVDGDAQRLSQLVWLLFLKIFDDKEKEYELVVRDKSVCQKISLINLRYLFLQFLNNKKLLLDSIHFRKKSES